MTQHREKRARPWSPSGLKGKRIARKHRIVRSCAFILLRGNKNTRYFFSPWSVLSPRLRESQWHRCGNETERENVTLSRILTGTRSGYFRRIFSPSAFLFSKGCSSLYWNFIVPVREDVLFSIRSRYSRLLLHACSRRLYLHKSLLQYTVGDDWLWRRQRRPTTRHGNSRGHTVTTQQIAYALPAMRITTCAFALRRCGLRRQQIGPFRFSISNVFSKIANFSVSWQYVIFQQMSKVSHKQNKYERNKRNVT